MNLLLINIAAKSLHMTSVILSQNYGANVQKVINLKRHQGMKWQGD